MRVERERVYEREGGEIERERERERDEGGAGCGSEGGRLGMG